MKSFDVIIVGGGATGLWTALDLSLRGFSVALIERSQIGSGTSGKFHGLLHSGARYAVNDPDAAIECINENQILSRIAGHTVEDTGGYFVAITKEDDEYGERFLPALEKVGIPYKEIRVDEALREEPELNRNARRVIEVPDKVVYARDLLVSVALTAYNNGAIILENISAERIQESNDLLSIDAIDTLSGRKVELRAKVVINAAGPWAHKVANAAGVNVELMPTAGLMVVYAKRLTKRVMNRMRPPSDGDILVPYVNTSIMGTTATVIEDPESVQVEQSDIDFLTSEGSTMIPKLKDVPVIRVYYSVRPLIRVENEENAGRIATRGFQVIIHDKPKGMISIFGGKFTTARLMAERIGDATSKMLGEEKASKTRERKLEGSNPYEALKELAGESALGNLASLIGGIDEDRGRVAAYVMLQEMINRKSREKLGI